MPEIILQYYLPQSSNGNVLIAASAPESAWPLFTMTINSTKVKQIAFDMFFPVDKHYRRQKEQNVSVPSQTQFAIGHVVAATTSSYRCSDSWIIELISASFSESFIVNYWLAEY